MLLGSTLDPGSALAGTSNPALSVQGKDDLPEAARVNAQRARHAVRQIGVDERIIDRIVRQLRLLKPMQKFG